MSDGVDDERLGRILAFFEEADRFKSVYRGAYLTDRSRNESDADHVWHLCMFAISSARRAHRSPIPARLRALPDTRSGRDLRGRHLGLRRGRIRRQEGVRGAPAGELFSLLPEDLTERFRYLWDEFEEGRAEEARFAQAMDRLQGFAQNVFGGGRIWRERSVTESETRKRVEEGIAFDPSLAAAFETLYERAQRERAWDVKGEDRSADR